jgi:hypothetical protein
MTLPTAPTGVTNTPGDNKLTINWTAVIAAPAVDHYEWRKGSNGSWKTNVPPTAISVVVTELMNDKPQQIQIRAVNSDGPGAFTSTTGTPVDSNPANDNGYDDATFYANPGLIPHLNWNDPDD